MAKNVELSAGGVLMDDDGRRLTVGALAATGGTTGQIPTVQADGTIALATPSATSGSGFSNVVQVASHATGGTGTAASPYTGWESSVVNTDGKTYFFDGVFATSSVFSFQGSSNVRLLGVNGHLAQFESAGGTAHQSNSVLIYTGTGASTFINARATHGFRLEGLIVQASSGTYTGTLVDGSGTGSGDTQITVGLTMLYAGLDVSTGTGVAGPPCCLNLANTVEVYFDYSDFYGGVYGVKGFQGSGWANVAIFRGCRFIGQWTAAFYNPYWQWTIDTCIFEPNANGSGQGRWIVGDTNLTNLAVINCYQWDMGQANVPTIDAPNGALVDCTFNGNSCAGTTIFSLQSFNGLTVIGNAFSGPAASTVWDTLPSHGNNLSFSGNTVAGSMTDNTGTRVGQGRITASFAVDATGAIVAPAAISTGPASAPAITSATAGDTSATVIWTAPTNSNGSTITGYELRTYNDSTGALVATDEIGNVLTYTKTGLTNGTAYHFKVAAINGYGVGGRSAASSAVTPFVFSPTDIAGLAGWWKADGTLYQDSARTTLATADSAPVGSVTDNSGNSRHLSQATSGLRPLLRTAVQNGLPILRFDGADDFLSIAAGSLTVAQPDTIFLVVKSATANTSANLLDSNSGARQLVQGTGLGDHYQMYAGAGPNGGVGAASSATFHVQTYQFNGAASLARVDGGVLIATNSAGSNSLTGMNLGANIVPGSYWNGDIAEVLVYSGALTTPQMVQVEAYLKSRWGTP